MEDYLIVESIQNGLAVCETKDKRICAVPLASLPAATKAGDVLVLISGKYEINEQETARRKQLNKNLYKSLLSDK